MRNYLKAYHDALQCGTFVPVETLEKHINQQATIDKLLPDSSSFFYVVEVPAYKYHFLGKQQVLVSGYSNEEFIEEGLELLFRSIHPEDVELVLDKVFPLFTMVIGELDYETRKQAQFQYNYRFKRKDGKFLNLMEQVYVLELDENGIPTLLLGNVIVLGTTNVLPVRVSCKIIGDSGLSETIFSESFETGRTDLACVTSRELDILRNLAAGKSSREIGNELFISRHTVDTHRRNLLKKLKCKSVVELTRVAFQHGLL